jgi:predicted metal-dependent phosphoesterase TrpH
MEYLEKFQQERYKRAAKMIRNLNQLGVRLTMDEVEGRARGQSIGRPHLAEVLMEKGYVETFQEAFQRYIGYGSEAYEEKYKIGPEEAIGLISEARGLSFLAHPGYPVTDEVIFKFVKSGLDGIEIIHPKFNESRTQHLHKLAKEHGLLVSGGSDCHGGRNGSICMGTYCLPYALLEDIRHAFRLRWSENGTYDPAGEGSKD